MAVELVISALNSNARDPGAPLSDDEREALIDQTMRLMLAAKTRGCRVYWAEQMRKLIGQRSPEQIRQMELERGLRT